MSNIPKPASPLPWTICREVPGYSDESHILQDKHHYKVAMHLRLTAAWPADLAYLAWAANNAQALYELLSRVCKYLDDESDIETASPVHADIAAALKAARGEA